MLESITVLEEYGKVPKAYKNRQNREKMGVSAGKFHMFSRRISKGKITTKKDWEAGRLGILSLLIPPKVQSRG